MPSRSCTACGAQVRDAAVPRCPACSALLPEATEDPSGRFRGHEDVVAAQARGMRTAGRGPKLLALVVLLVGVVIAVLIGTSGPAEPPAGDGAGQSGGGTPTAAPAHVPVA